MSYDFGVTDELAARVRQVSGNSVHLVSHPGLVAAMVSGNASSDQIHTISGFVDALELAKQVRLVRGSGSTVELTDHDRMLLGTINEPFDDVDHQRVQNVQIAGLLAQSVARDDGGGGNWFTKALHNTQSALFNNPVVRPLAAGLNRAYDFATTPLRAASAVGPGGLFVNPLTGSVHISDSALANINEITADATADGYDPSSSASTLAFLSRGKQVYKATNDLREKFGSTNVDAAKAYLTNPEGFLDPSLDADTLGLRVTASNDPQFKDLIARVDARRASPGRDLANAVGVRPGTTPYHLISGATDAFTAWYIDPFLIAGKAAQAQKIGSRGLNSMMDAPGVVRIMTTNKAVRRGWTAFLDDAKKVRSTDDAEKAAGLAGIRARTPALVPLIDEVNGARAVPHFGKGEVEIRKADPIETYDELVQHVAGTAALTRLTNGLAASQGILMPGAISGYAARAFGYRAARGAIAGRTARRGVATGIETGTLDVSTAPWRIFATGDDAVFPPMSAAAASLGPESKAGLQGSAVKTATDPLAKMRRQTFSFERTSRRLTSLLPTATSIEYDAVAATEQFRRFALTYMPKAQANLFAAAFSNGDIAARRAIYKGAVEQMIHTSGMESSFSGRKLAEAMRSDASAAEKQHFSTIGVDEMTDDAGTRHVGMWPDQMSTEMWMPSFAKMQQAAAKAGIWDHTMGAVLNSHAVDALVSTIRTGWLVAAANAMRNAMDEVGAFTASGMSLRNYAKARGTLSQQIGRRMLVRELPEAEGALDIAKQTLNDVPYTGIRDAQREVKFAKGEVRKLKVLSWYHRAAGIGFNGVVKVFPLKGLTHKEMADSAGEVAEDIGRHALDYMDGLGRKAGQSTVAADSREEAADIAKAGLTPRGLKWKLSAWDSVSTDGEAGARAWSHNLDQRFGESGLGVAVLHLLTENEPHEIRRAIGGTLANDARYADFREQAEFLRFLKDKEATPEMQRARMDEFVDRLASDLGSQILDRQGRRIEPLVKYLKTFQRAPSIDWIERHIPNEFRPESAIGRKWVPAPPEDSRVVGVLKGYSNSLTKAYDVVVNKPINHLSRQPIYAVGYALARKNLVGYEKALVDGGIDATRASELTRDLARTHAWDRTVQFIDDPEIQSQFSVLSRNFVNFERATEQFMRRWGSVLKEDPSRIRKAQLTYQAAVHSGVIDHDAAGNPIFVYPGSGAMINALLGAANLLPGVDMIRIPVVPNMHSQVVFLNPSLDNPLQLSVSPVVGMPVRWLGHFFPDHSLGFSQADQIMNGNLGAGRSWWQQFMPSAVNRFFSALNSNDRQSQVASAMRNSIVNLHAMGLTPPPDASPDEVDNFLHAVKVQSRNQLFVRSIFAFFMPAAPSLPEESAGEGNAADAVYQAQGISGMKDEFRKMVSDFGYEKALQVWTKVHPDQLAYTVGTTTSKGGAFIPPTDSALRFIDKNMDLFKSNPSIAAYFLPQAPEEFSPAAWNAELGMNLRQYKDIAQFYKDVSNVGAARIYYAARDQRDKAIASAMEAGDTEGVKAIRADWTQRAVEFNALNPLFAAQLAGYDDQTPRKQQSLIELHGLIEAGKLPGLAGKESAAVADMLGAYQRHIVFTDQMRSRRDADSEAQKQAEQSAYKQYQEALVLAHPDIKDLYNGLFRGLN